MIPKELLEAVKADQKRQKERISKRAAYRHKLESKENNEKEK